MSKSKRPLIILAHYLSGARFDVWIRLLLRNIRYIAADKVPQCIYLTILTLILFPFAILERILFAIPIHRTKIEKPPVHIIGIWRSGTTNVQYTLSKDPQFGWLDPVNTVIVNNSILLGWLLKPVLKRILVDARPMDNMEYKLDLPMEDVYALATYSVNAFNHMMSFTLSGEPYIESIYNRELPEKLQKEWRRKYNYLLKKTTFVKGGKQLMLKSPDNSCHIKEFVEDYPGTKFVLICRNPYKIIPSMMKTFRDISGMMTLEDQTTDEIIEMYAFDMFERMNKMMIEDLKLIPEGDYVLIRHEEFAKDPIGVTEHVYEELGLEGFEEARPYMQAYQDTQREYRPNKHQMDPQLKKKINERCRFYFEYFNYEIEE